jgi:probable rRNA maturation factor
VRRGDPIIYINRLPVGAGLAVEDVRRAVRAAAVAERLEGGEISVTFLDAEAMAALNAAHRDLDRPTDVLAFDLGESGAPLGDIYICPAVAAEAAEEMGIGLKEELLRLAIHGVLHLAGHDHPEGPDHEQSEMFRRQEAILAHLL